MANENEQADIEIPDDESFEGIEDAAELKNKLDEVQRKHREAGIRNRERTKALKERLAASEAKSTSPASDTKVSKTDEESRLLAKLDRTTLRAAGITEPDEVELAKTTAKKWGMDLDEVVDDEDFKTKLEKVRATKANINATTNLRGGTGTSGGTKTLDYYIQRYKETGELPQTTDRKILAAFGRSQMQGGSATKKFYNDN